MYIDERLKHDVSYISQEACILGQGHFSSLIHIRSAESVIRLSMLTSTAQY